MTLKNTSEKMFRTSIKIAIYVFVILGIIIVAKSSYSFGESIFTGKGKDSAPGKDITITVSKGESLKEIANDAKTSGIVDNSIVFYIQLKLYMSKSDKIKEGQYTLNSSMSGENLVNKLIAGDEQDCPHRPPRCQPFFEPHSKK